MSYTNNLSDVMAFVDSSINCSQFTKFSCIGMSLLDGALIDRVGNVMGYFGGGPENGKGR